MEDNDKASNTNETNQLITYKVNSVEPFLGDIPYSENIGIIKIYDRLPIFESDDSIILIMDMKRFAFYDLRNRLIRSLQYYEGKNKKIIKIIFPVMPVTTKQEFEKLEIWIKDIKHSFSTKGIALEFELIDTNEELPEEKKEIKESKVFSCIDIQTTSIKITEMKHSSKIEEFSNIETQSSLDKNEEPEPSSKIEFVDVNLVDQGPAIKKIKEFPNFETEDSLIVIMNTKPLSKANFLELIGKKLNFPSWWGKNLDAFWDCICCMDEFNCTIKKNIQIIFPIIPYQEFISSMLSLLIKAQMSCNSGHTLPYTLDYIFLLPEEIY